MKRELEVIIYIGCPASGKSTEADKFIRRNPDYVRVSRDQYRYMLKDQSVVEPKIESLINDLIEFAILKALSKKLNVIVDNTNLKAKTIRSIIKLVNSYANVSYRVFDIPYKTLLERDAKRERPAGQLTIDRMWKEWEILKDSFDFQPVMRNMNNKRFYLKQKEDLIKAIIIDIDGTLALINGRDPYDESLVEYDDVNEPVANIVKKYNGVKIIVSGRTEDCRTETENWLKMNNIEYDYLFMRASDDIRKDKLVKKEIFENYIKDKFYIEYVLDDRDQVVEQWRNLGLLCLQVYRGLF